IRRGTIRRLQLLHPCDEIAVGGQVDVAEVLHAGEPPEGLRDGGPRRLRTRTSEEQEHRGRHATSRDLHRWQPYAPSGAPREIGVERALARGAITPRRRRPGAARSRRRVPRGSPGAPLHGAPRGSRAETPPRTPPPSPGSSTGRAHPRGRAPAL